MSEQLRPAEHLVHGITGAVVVIDGRVCAMLDQLLNLSEVRSRVRGRDAQLDQSLLAIRLAAIYHRNGSSSSGTVLAAHAEPVSASAEQLNETVSTTTAAFLLGITGRAVRKAIHEKRIPAIQLSDGRYRINRKDLER